MEPAAKDPILGVTEAFLADPSPDKVNVGVVSSLCLPLWISIAFCVFFFPEERVWGFCQPLLFLCLVFFFSFDMEMEGKGGTVWKFCLFLLLFWALEEMEDFD